jgi:hypothetical protein
MRVSLKKFANDPYKYAKKAPITIMLGDTPTYTLIPYITYKEHFKVVEEKHNQVVVTPELPIDKPKKPNFLQRILFS